MVKQLLRILFLFFSLLVFYQASATHLRAGEITVQRTNCALLTFEITITVYLDTQSGVQFGGYDLEFGDGTSILVPPMQPTIPRPDLGQFMGMARFTTTHTYGGNQPVITIRYTESNRNEFVVNMDESVFTKFYLETTIYLDPFLSCNTHLPLLQVVPIDRACQGVMFTHNPGAIDLDGDSLSYELTVPRRGFDNPVINYKDPNDSKFYTDYQHANEIKQGAPTFSIDSHGTLAWDAPGMLGEYNVAFRVVEWRKDLSGIWRKISYVTRDMQIIVEDCDNHRPDLILPADTCVTAGAVIDKTILGFDPDNDAVKIEAFSEIFDISSPATYTPKPGFSPSSPPAKLHFRWNTQCDQVKEQYYQVVFKITDKPARGPMLVTFRTWRIRVVGPPPQWRAARTDLATRTATVTWQNYFCQNAVSMQVWRKVDGDPFVPDHCQNGMPALGYSLLSTVPLRDASNQEVISFTDNNHGQGLAPGARYCYRLVAIFPQPKGGLSYVSQDVCLPPILSDAPVVTHVTVEQTDLQDGRIRISWRSPLAISHTQFPGPYEYAVYRGEGLQGENLIRVTPDQHLRDTTFLDAGIDTETRPYHYRIVLYSNTSDHLQQWIKVDSSAVASSVWLEAKAHTQQIDLDWKAEVPWSNASARFPYHLIYRGDDPSQPGDFIQIDEADASQGKFVYSDHGQYDQTPLDKNRTYCYRILTRGVYGNPLIAEPLENFSQVICALPDSDAKPCAPVVSLTSMDCEAYFSVSKCQVQEFSNRLSWHMACSKQVRSFRVYASAGNDKEFTLVADNVVDTFYVDRNLLSFARCYKVTAVNAQGNESEASTVMCNDNCPHFELPNIFTPNGDGCNEYFSAYGPSNPINKETPESCLRGEDNTTKCMRFVEQVTFHVYNRWGREVYTFRSTGGTGEKSTYINWDGRDNDGRALSSGVYYYLAYVTFDMLDPSRQRQTYKGWVQLTR